MWTLLFTSTQGTYRSAVGIFPSEVDAQTWAMRFLPQLSFVAIELMLQPEHAEVIHDAELFTRSSGEVAMTVN